MDGDGGTGRRDRHTSAGDARWTPPRDPWYPCPAQPPTGILPMPTDPEGAPMRVSRTWLALAAVLTTTMSLIDGGVARADGRSVTFESFATGTVNGQDGWTSMGAAGSGCATYDH